ncbi:hypothetical protein Krac_6004 [Ktedonobacter racemifer DSM 44963]|uniref:Uncharacterized protein n=1 Tax=Ktedonobacter racemifer DSM 44963 TaxID=485913 RepID=D6TXF4_KTERA|nr:hypothetical protein Krac_6004 [Ktedonobacter racemifer DSM 44963]
MTTPFSETYSYMDTPYAVFGSCFSANSKLFARLTPAPQASIPAELAVLHSSYANAAKFLAAL